MGQYYMPLIKRDDTVDVYANFVNGEYIMAKLMEHSWYNNPFVNAIAKMIYKAPAQIAWVGDYADDDDPKIYDMAYSEGVEHRKDLTYDGEFDLDNKYLLDHTKKLYVDCSEYKDKAKDEWIIHPLSLLTAVGNGLGGGDYRGGKCKDKVGSWRMDLISIEDEPPMSYAKLNVFFEE